jgi:glycosyltransferase involved in cell wall biosynthesis
MAEIGETDSGTLEEVFLSKAPEFVPKISVFMVSTFPPDRDGIASYTARLKKTLDNRKISVNVLANGKDWRRNSLTYIFSIIKKTSPPCNPIVHFQLSYFTFGNEYYTGLFPLTQLGLKLFHKKTVITLHDIVQKPRGKNEFIGSLCSDNFLAIKQRALEYFTKIVCLIADRIIVHSEIAQNVLIRDYRVDPKKISVIPHGIDQHAAKNPNKEFILRKPIVSYFGFVRKGKGLEDLVMAWKKIKCLDAQLQIIGGRHPHIKDKYYENLVNLVEAQNLQDSISFCGYIPTDELPNYLSISDAFVFPYNEWGDIIASSGALSIVSPYLKPIIATDVPAFQGLKNFGAAKIVKKGDIQELASMITEVLTNEKTNKALENSMCKWLPLYSWSAVAEKTEEVYRDLLKK